MSIFELFEGVEACKVGLRRNACNEDVTIEVSLLIQKADVCLLRVIIQYYDLLYRFDFPGPRQNHEFSSAVKNTHQPRRVFNVAQIIRRLAD
jgi:hypothetical protein